MLRRLAASCFRAIKIFVGGLLAIYVVSFDPPLIEVCGFVSCKLVRSPAHWTTLVCFAIATPLLVTEFWAIVRKIGAQHVVQFEHELTAPHTGRGSDPILNVGTPIDLFLAGPCIYGDGVPGGVYCPS